MIKGGKLQKAFDQACAENIDKIWLKSAIELVSQNPTHPFVYAAVVTEFLSKGKGELWNNLESFTVAFGRRNCKATSI